MNLTGSMSVQGRAAPGFVEAVWFKSDRHRGGLTGEMPVAACLGLCGRDVADGLEKSMVVELGDLLKRR